jgi:hypothetical protein
LPLKLLVRQWMVEGSALLHCAKLEQARSLIRVGQIAGVSSAKAAATRSGVGSSIPSS